MRKTLRIIIVCLIGAVIWWAIWFYLPFSAHATVNPAPAPAPAPNPIVFSKSGSSPAMVLDAQSVLRFYSKDGKETSSYHLSPQDAATLSAAFGRASDQGGGKP